MLQYFEGYVVEDALVGVQFLADCFSDYFCEVFDTDFHGLCLGLVLYLRCFFMHTQDDKHQRFVDLFQYLLKESQRDDSCRLRKKLCKSMYTGLFSLPVNRIQSQQINLIEQLHPKRITILAMLRPYNHLHMIENTPNQVNNLILLILIIIDNSNRIYNSNDLLYRLYLE